MRRGMFGKREEHHRDLADLERSFVDAGLFTQLYGYVGSGEGPLGPRQFTRGHRAVMDDVTLLTDLVDLFAGKRERGRSDERYAVQPVKAEADGPDSVIEFPCLRIHVIGRVAAGNVLAVSAAVESDVPIGGGLAGFVVVGGVVAVQDPAFVVDLNVAAQRIEAGVLLLALRADDSDLFLSGGRHDLGRSGRRRFLLGGRLLWDRLRHDELGLLIALLGAGK